MARLSLSPNSRTRSRLLSAAGGGGGGAPVYAIATGGTVITDTASSVVHEFSAGGTFSLDELGILPVSLTISGTATFGDETATGTTSVAGDGAGAGDVTVTVTSGTVEVEYDPADLITPTLVLDASDETTLTLSGSNVTNWDDKSDNAYAFPFTGSVASGAQSGTRTINSLNVVDFDGNGGFSAQSRPLNNTTDRDWYVFGVVEFDSVASAMFLLDGDRTSVEGTRIAQYMKIDASANTLNVGFHSGGTYADTGPTVSASTPVVFESYFIGGTGIEVLVDGAGSGGSSSAANDSSFSSGARTSIGCTMRNGFSFGLNGAIGEITAFDKPLTADDATAWRELLADKWGITL